MKTHSMLLAGLAMAFVGCEDRSYESSPMAAKSESAVAFAPAAPAAPPAPAEGMMMMGMMRGMAGDADKAPVAPLPAGNVATANRKIIYNASVDLVTEDLGKLEAALLELVAARGAYVADSDRTGSAGDNRHGNWKVRVPVESYDAFLRGAMALGELVSVKADSQDVSEEFYDLEAREKAKKVEEERLLKHLADSTGKLEEILAVERELSRVRGEIEQMQGRLRVLANLTSLATVTVSAREVKGYVPPQAPTLATKISRTFSDSLDSLRKFGEAVLLAVVALAPWLPLILVGLVLAFWAGRKLLKAIQLAQRGLNEAPR